jgi:uncharacterized protein (DUF2267 family)
MTARNPPPGVVAERNKRTAGRLVLDEIQSSERMPTTLAPERVFAAVMCALERAVGGDPARIERGLPANMRRMIAGCEAHVEDELRRLPDAREFMHSVAEHLEMPESDAQELTRVVFHAVHRLMSEAEVDALADEMPEDLRGIWRAA